MMLSWCKFSKGGKGDGEYSCVDLVNSYPT